MTTSGRCCSAAERKRKPWTKQNRACGAERAFLRGAAITPRCFWAGLPAAALPVPLLAPLLRRSSDDCQAHTCRAACRGMSKDGTWGDELTLRALCEALAVVVNVISSGGGPGRHPQLPPFCPARQRVGSWCWEQVVTAAVLRSNELLLLPVAPWVCQCFPPSCTTRGVGGIPTAVRAQTRTTGSCATSRGRCGPATSAS